MDLAAIVFAAVLLVIGLALIVFVRVGSAGGDPAADEGGRALRQEQLREERRMQRRRWRVWHRVDEMHALFIERAMSQERELSLLPAAATPPPPSTEDFTDPDMEAAFDLFLREDFLKAGHAQASRKSAENA